MTNEHIACAPSLATNGESTWELLLGMQPLYEALSFHHVPAALGGGGEEGSVLIRPDFAFGIQNLQSSYSRPERPRASEKA